MVGILFGLLLLLAIGYFGVLCFTEVALWLRSQVALRSLVQPQRLASVISQLLVK